MSCLQMCMKYIFNKQALKGLLTHTLDYFVPLWFVSFHSHVFDINVIGNY